MPSKDAGRLARVFVLGTLDSNGPTHGHEIRRLAERVDVENWSDASVGSIYNALRRLHEEGLIEPVRTEQVGRRPTRTVYALTTTGQTELASLRDKLLYEVALPNDPFDVALWVSAGLPAEQLGAVIDRRSAALTELQARLSDERARLTAAGYLPPAGQVLFRHAEIRVEAELRWHAEVRERLTSPTEPGGGLGTPA